ncbi:MAG: cyanophycin synthetase, partial [Longicatena sp.]
KQNDYVVNAVQQKSDGITFSINNNKIFHIDMIGKHQAMNATAAYMVALALGLHEEEIEKGFASIEKTGLRNELVPIKRALILNDSYKSNPQSALAALDTMEAFDIPYKIAVLGDMLELGETSDIIHYKLGKELQKYTLHEVITIGNQARYIAQGANDNLEHVKVQHMQDKEALIQYLRPYLEKDCMILDEVVDALTNKCKGEVSNDEKN